MATKASAVKALGSASKGKVPRTPQEAATFADLAAQLTAAVKEWFVRIDAVSAQEKSAVSDVTLRKVSSSVDDLAQQVVQLQVSFAESGRVPLDQWLSYRYVTARRAFASDTEMADELRVNRSQITRWKQGAIPDSSTAERLLGLDAVITLLDGFLDSESVPKWLRGVNAHLDHRRPLDVLREGRLSDVIRAIEAEKEGAFA